jgi:hypothetical protein
LPTPSGGASILVHASERELVRNELASSDFQLAWQVPVIIDTAKLPALGWESSLHSEALARPVDEHRESDRTGRHHGLDYEAQRHTSATFVN